jgi:histidinol-phosphate aminotransferase
MKKTIQRKAAKAKGKVAQRDIEGLVRKDLRALETYQPIVLPGALPTDGTQPGGRRIKLDGNENPYGCSPRVLEALRSYQGYNIYPDPDQRELRKAIAAYAGADPASVLAGAGSDELIDLLMRLFLDPGDTVLNFTPTFGMYSFNTAICGGRAINIPRRQDYTIDLKRALRSVRKDTKLIFIANPNNPTGTLTPRNDILRLLKTGAIVVVDEAYYEFSGMTVADLVAKHKNLIVLRTFSKWAGLAGLRVGYGIMPPAIVQRLMAIKPPYNVNVAAQVAVLESLKDIDYLKGTVKKILDERDRLFVMLENLDFMVPAPTQSNFILSKVIDRNPKKMRDDLRTQGIFLRYFDTPGLGDCIRISVGLPQDTDALIWALRAWEDYK